MMSLLASSLAGVLTNDSLLLLPIGARSRAWTLRRRWWNRARSASEPSG